MFKLFRFRVMYLRFFRGLSIVFVLLGYFWVNWMSNRRFTRRFVSKKYKRNGSIISTHERLRTVIEKLGPTFIKFGQILADRPDIISEKLRLELKKLQTEVEPFDHDVAKELIEKELGGSIDKFFDYISPTCIGSASIGQVYKARLLNGDHVVIKVQRPNIRDRIRLDLQLMEFLAGKLATEYPELVVMDVTGFVKEFGETLTNELNYFNEAGNAMRFAEMFADVPYCKIPKVYTDLSTDKLLVLEYMDGVSPDYKDELIANGLDPKEVARNGTLILLKMIFEHGFFHADPHAGNIFVQAGNRVALIDFGMAGALKPSHMQFLAGFVEGMATKNPQMLADSLLKLDGTRLFKEKEDLEFVLREMLDRYGSIPYEKIRFSKVLEDCVKIIQRFGLRIPASIYLLLKAVATVEKFGYNLDPDISLASYIKPFAENIIKKKYSPRMIAGEVYDTVRNYARFIRSFPGEAAEIMYNIKQGKLIHDIQLGNADSVIHSFRHVGRILSLSFIISFMLAGSAILIALGRDTMTIDIMFGVSSVVAAWLLIRLFFKVTL